ncbi:MAG: sulfatase-like hydrolase/transferase, partial [Bacteroidota bacterium]
RLFLLSLSLTFCLSCEKVVNIPARVKNIVVIVGDDHAMQVVRAYGNQQIQTPNLDRLAAGGIRFTNAFANAPMCSASRQSMLTGRYPHAAGVTLLRTSFPNSQYTVAEHLQAHGFQTALFGKHHFNNNGHHGFQTLISQAAYKQYLSSVVPTPLADSIPVRPVWKPFRDHARIWLNAEARPDQYEDQHSRGTFYAREACQWIANQKDSAFFAWIAFNEPHSPFNFPHTFWKKYLSKDMSLPDISPEDSRWIPAVFQDLTETEKRGIISAYYASVSYLDKNVGLILDQLDKLKIADETLIVYLSDHGYLLADHGRFEKHMMWEEAIRVPLIIGVKAEWGLSIGERNQMIELVDLAPTLLDAAGVEQMATAQGKSFWPVLLEPTKAHKQQVFAEFLADEKLMVRNQNWKYIFTPGSRDLQQGYATGFGPSGVSHRLYDLEKDPLETHNLGEETAFQERIVGFQDTLLRWLAHTHPLGRKPQGSRIKRLTAYSQPPEGFAPGAR